MEALRLFGKGIESMEIQIVHAYKSIRKARILEDIHIALVSGYVYGFQGVNGSGKTMLMRLITGVIRPTKGEVLFDGKKLGKDLDFPPKTGMLLERPAFLEEYTGMRNLKLLAELDGNISDKQIRRALLRVGLNPEDRRKYRKYSLGMKQRLGIAAAIMGTPELIVLDEPTNALDEEGYRRLLEIVREERERGALILLACHDRQFLEALSDVVFVMEEGRIVR